MRLFRRYKVVWRWLVWVCKGSGKEIKLLPIPFFYKREEEKGTNSNDKTNRPDSGER